MKVKTYNEEDVLSGDIGTPIFYIAPKGARYGFTDLTKVDVVRYEYDREAKAMIEKVKFYTNEVKVESHKVVEGKILVSILNESKDMISRIGCGIIYYDKENNIIGYNELEDYNLGSNMTIEENFDNYVLDKKGNKVNYDHYEVVINYACTEDF